MEDLTQRLINALRKAVTNARNADDAAEAAYLADALDVEGAPVVPATATFSVDATPGAIVESIPGPPPPIGPDDLPPDAQVRAPAPKKSKGA
jgi:hypothetical protein